MSQRAFYNTKRLILSSISSFHNTTIDLPLFTNFTTGYESFRMNEETTFSSSIYNRIVKVDLPQLSLFTTDYRSFYITKRLILNSNFH